MKVTEQLISSCATVTIFNVRTVPTLKLTQLKVSFRLAGDEFIHCMLIQNLFQTPVADLSRLTTIACQVVCRLQNPMVYIEHGIAKHTAKM